MCRAQRGAVALPGRCWRSRQQRCPRRGRTCAGDGENGPSPAHEVTEAVADAREECGHRPAYAEREVPSAPYRLWILRREGVSDNGVCAAIFVAVSSAWSRFMSHRVFLSRLCPLRLAADLPLAVHL